MKILYHHRTASSDGQSVHIDEMIAAFQDLGHEVRVVSPATASKDGSEKYMGSEVGWVRRLKLFLPRAAYEVLEFGYSLVAYWRLAVAVKEFKPDFIYERYNLFLLAGVFIKKRYGLPLLLEVNAPLVDERSKHSGGIRLEKFARWAEDYVWRQADYVLPVTHVLGNIIRERGVRASKIKVIPNGINKNAFLHAPSIDRAKVALGLEANFVLGFTGFVRDWHGVDKVLTWMASKAAPQNCFLLIVGDGPVRTDLEMQAVNLGLRDRVFFTGVIDHHLVPSHVAAFDVALQPAVTAYASPLKLMEYLALGKAVIAPSQPNLREILQDKKNSLLFDPKIPGDFEASLTLLCSDEVLREQISDGALKTIDHQGLTWRANARRVAELIE